MAAATRTGCFTLALSNFVAHAPARAALDPTCAAGGDADTERALPITESGRAARLFVQKGFRRCCPVAYRMRLHQISERGMCLPPDRQRHLEPARTNFGEPNTAATQVRIDTSPPLSKLCKLREVLID